MLFPATTTTQSMLNRNQTIRTSAPPPTVRIATATPILPSPTRKRSSATRPLMRTLTLALPRSFRPRRTSWLAAVAHGVATANLPRRRLPRRRARNASAKTTIARSTAASLEPRSARRAAAFKSLSTLALSFPHLLGRHRLVSTCTRGGRPLADILVAFTTTGCQEALGAYQGQRLARP